MLSYLLNRRALVTIIRKQAQYQVLELRAKTVAIHFSKIEIDLSSEKEVIEVLFFACLFKGEDALDNDEQNYA